MHTLKSLWEKTVKSFPEIKTKFNNLEEYCYDSLRVDHQVKLNRSYNSLKWFIYGLRERITSPMIESLFVSLIFEAATTGRENDLYDNIKSFKSTEPYVDLIVSPLVLGDTIDVNGWKVYINESDMNITSMIFNKRIADVIIFRNSVGHAGMVFRERDTKDGGETGITKAFHIPNIFLQICKKYNKEVWTLVGRNLIICGGTQHPENTTRATTEELLNILRDNAL